MTGLSRSAHCHLPWTDCRAAAAAAAIGCALCVGVGCALGRRAGDAVELVMAGFCGDAAGDVMTAAPDVRVVSKYGQNKRPMSVKRPYKTLCACNVRHGNGN